VKLRGTEIDVAIPNLLLSGSECDLLPKNRTILSWNFPTTAPAGG
jgi:hypothetical protein